MRFLNPERIILAAFDKRTGLVSLSLPLEDAKAIRDYLEDADYTLSDFAKSVGEFYKALESVTVEHIE